MKVTKSTKPAVVAKPIKTVVRTVFYYEILFPKVPAADVRETMRKIFQKIKDLNDSKSPQRFDDAGEGEKNCMRDVLFFGDKNHYIKGKMLRLREDVFPEIFKEKTDSLVEMDADDEDSIAETSHFILDTRTSKPILALERNHHGPKVVDMVSYINKIVTLLGMTSFCIHDTKTKDELGSYTQRMNRCSEFIACVHKNELKRVASVHNGLATAFQAAEDCGQPEYIVVKMKFEWKKVTMTPFTKIAKGIISKLVGNKKLTDIFDTLVITAEDSERRNKLTAFDLLSDKINSEVRVQRKDKAKTVVSIDMYEKMETELHRLF